MQREAATTPTALMARPDLIHLTVAISVAMTAAVAGGAAGGAGGGAAARG